MKRLAWLLVIAVLALAPVSGRAQSADEAFAALASNSFDPIRQGVEALALSGHPQAAAILTALKANKLFFRSAERRCSSRLTMDRSSTQQRASRRRM